MHNVHTVVFTAVIFCLENFFPVQCKSMDCICGIMVITTNIYLKIKKAQIWVKGNISNIYPQDVK